MASSHVFDVTAQTFQSTVVARSATVPVLLDFWAEWCEPCKALAPILEKLADEFGGAFLLGRVDSEVEVELGQAFQVQSIPFGVLISRGRPVDAFAGSIGEDQIRALLTKHGIDPAGEDEPEDPDSPVARIRVAREAAARGDVAAVRAALEGFPEESAQFQERDNLLRGLDFLEAELPSDPQAAALLAGARVHFLAGRFEDALSAIVASAQEDRGYGGGMARIAMLLCQGTLGDTDVVDDYRRQLATLLY